MSIILQHISSAILTTCVNRAIPKSASDPQIAQISPIRMTISVQSVESADQLFKKIGLWNSPDAGYLFDGRAIGIYKILARPVKMLKLGK